MDDTEEYTDNSEEYTSDSDEQTSDSESNPSNNSNESDCIDKTKGNNNLGALVNGEYVLIEKIGHGTFSAVWLAYKFIDPTGKHFYAMKVHHQDEYEEGQKEALYLEKLKELKSPYIIHMYETFPFYPQGSECKHPHICLVFDLMVGSTYQLIKKGKYEYGLSEKIVAKIILQVSCALESIKNNLEACHTDIKPENILIKGVDGRLKAFQQLFLQENFPQKFKILCDKIIIDNKFKLTNKKHKTKYSKMKNELAKKIIININNKINKTLVNNGFNKNLKYIDIDENSDIQIVLADFGTIKLLEKTKYTDCIQTRYYRAPEILLECDYNHKVDIWSLGCVAFELLTGEPLFNPEKDKSNNSLDYHHIYWIIELLGDFPKSLLSKSHNYKEFFHSSGRFRGTKPTLNTLNNVFREDVKIECSSTMINLMENMINISPEKRLDYPEIIDYINSNYL